MSQENHIELSYKGEIITNVIKGDLLMLQSFTKKKRFLHVCAVLFLGLLVSFSLHQTKNKEAESIQQAPNEEAQHTESIQANENHLLAPIASREQITELLEQAEEQLRTAERLIATQEYTSPGGERLLLIYRKHRPSEMIWYTLSNYDGSGDHFLLRDGEWYYSHQEGIFEVGMHSSISLARDYKLNFDPPASVEWQPLKRTADIPKVTLSLMTWQETDRSAMMPQVIFSFVQLMDDDRYYTEQTDQAAGNLLIYNPVFDYSQNDILWEYSIGVYSLTVYGQSMEFCIRAAGSMDVFYKYEYFINYMRG